MNTGRIADANHVFKAPHGWQEQRDGKCVDLAVKVEQNGQLVQMTSAWFPTDAELMKLSVGAPIYLTIIGAQHPPVMLTVGPLPKDTKP